MNYGPGEHPELCCFICHGQLLENQEIISWSGQSSSYTTDGEWMYTEIILHVECAHFMAAGMMRDVLEARVGPKKAVAWYKTYGRKPRTRAK